MPSVVIVKPNQLRESLMLHLLQAHRKTADPGKMMLAASEAVGRALRVDRVGFFDVRDDALLFAVGWTAGRLELLKTTLPVKAVGTRYLAEVLTGKTLGISDVSTNPLTADSQFRDIGTVSLIGVPIIRNGNWCAGFYIHHAEVRVWTGDEIELARDVGEQTWDAVERARAVNQLRQSEERLTLALEASGCVGTWDWDIAADRIYANARFAYLFSVDPARAAAGAPAQEYIDGIHPEDRASVRESIRLAFEVDPEYSVEYRVRPADGTTHWIHAQGRCHLNAAGIPLRLPGIAMDITKRKQTEFDLRRQWQTFDTALSHTVDFSYVFDLQGRFTYANRSILALLRISLDDIVGKNFLDLDYPPELAHRLQSQIQHVIQTSETLRDQTSFTGPSGELRFYEYIFVPVLGDNDRVEAVSGSTRDVTERRRAEELVAEDRRRWRELLCLAPAAIAVFRGPGHHFEWVNDEYSRVAGRSVEFLTGKTLLEAIPEVAGQVYIGLLDGVYRTGEPVVGHEELVQLIRGDGTLEAIYVNFVYLPTRNAGGIIDGIFVHATDVTDLVESRKRVEESAQRFRQLADSMPQIVCTARPDGQIDYYNERWYQFTGFGHAEEIDQNWGGLLHPEDAQRVHEAWDRCMLSGEPFQVESRVWSSLEKRWRWFMGRAVSVRDETGQIAKWFCTATDIDEYKTTQQAHLQTQKLESIGHLAGGIAHDFNNLLVGIMGGASFALNSVPSSHPAYEILQIIVSSSERAAHLTHQMLAYAGKTTFIIEAVDVSALAAQTLQLVKSSIHKSVTVRSEFDRHVPSVKTDVTQMQQIMMNLILNAAEAIGEKTGTLTLRTRAEEILSRSTRRNVDGAVIAPGTYVAFEVEDTGSGIDPLSLPKIFDPFFTTKFAGRGLGLAAVSGVVRSQSGAIEVETQLGKGSTFRVLMPASQILAAAATAPPVERLHQGQETVLVIDDEEVVRLVINAALSNLSYRVIVSASGAQGLEDIRHNPEISLVLLDMSMPEMGGKQVLESLRKTHPALPVVICSGHSEEEVSRHFSGMKFSGIMQKPFTPARLAAKIRSVLDSGKP